MGDGQRAPNGDYGVDALVADFTSIVAELREKAGTRRCLDGRYDVVDWAG